MSNYRLGLLLSIALLLGELKNYYCTSTPSDTMNANKREQLLTTMIEGYLNLTDYELKHSKALIQKVLSDSPIKEMHSDLMEAERVILENFVRLVTDKEREEPPSKDNTPNRFFYLIAKSLIYQEFESILRRHKTTDPRRKVSTENYLIELSLRRNGLDVLQRNIMMRQIKFMNDFVKEVEAYLATLTTAKRIEDEIGEPQQMIDWLAKMRRELNIQQRMEIFKDFMRFFVKF